MVKNPDPTIKEVYTSFGKDSTKNINGSTLIKTCPSGDYDRDNFCGISSGWTTFYTTEE